MKTISDGKFWEAITRSSPMYKPEIIRINISSSFMTRARCKNVAKDQIFTMPFLSLTNGKVPVMPCFILK